jgi:hypothetical protein
MGKKLSSERSLSLFRSRRSDEPPVGCDFEFHEVFKHIGHLNELSELGTSGAL